ncbi:hypothetical protein LSAT2_003623 [Lamellibrachia satsuma]|nr:hypothetical protein LSAT2_003623 [Lamellibrachia satsuma]
MKGISRGCHDDGDVVSTNREQLGERSRVRMKGISRGCHDDDDVVSTNSGERFSCCVTEQEGDPRTMKSMICCLLAVYKLCVTALDTATAQGSA